jgi:5-methylcytosine-specific restriction protein A
VPSTKEDAVLLFHTKEEAQQFYGDGWDEDDLYWYSGEGVLGDMRWTRANVAIRDHGDSGAELLLFERAQRTDGLWRLLHRMRYVAHKYAKRPDKSGRERKAIIFALKAVR